jgi:hypothetical protein
MVCKCLVTFVFQLFGGMPHLLYKRFGTGSWIIPTDVHSKHCLLNKNISANYKLGENFTGFITLPHSLTSL